MTKINCRVTVKINTDVAEKQWTPAPESLPMIEEAHTGHGANSVFLPFGQACYQQELPRRHQGQEL